MRTLIVGDHFVGADVFLEAIHKTLGTDFGPVRTVTWAGASMEEQHAEQQVMEWKGPEAVRTPIEVIQAAGDAEIIAVHFVPVPIAVLDAGLTWIGPTPQAIRDLGDKVTARHIATRAGAGGSCA